VPGQAGRRHLLRATLDWRGGTRCCSSPAPTLPARGRSVRGGRA